jgi:hypothetical protein
LAGDIMQVLLSLTNEIDMDTITEVMEQFVDFFSDELTPFAVQLGAQMVFNDMSLLTFREIHS